MTSLMLRPSFFAVDSAREDSSGEEGSKAKESLKCSQELLYGHISEETARACPFRYSSSPMVNPTKYEETKL